MRHRSSYYLIFLCYLSSLTFAESNDNNLLNDKYDVSQSLTTVAPSFLIATESILKGAVSSLLFNVGNSKFRSAAAEVIRSEVRLMERIFQSIKRFLSNCGSLKLRLHKEKPDLVKPLKVLPEATPIPILSGNFSELGVKSEKKISTPFAAFWSSVAASFALTFVTELGDRTFFIAALLSLKYPKLIVLIGTCLALISQAALSTCVGQL